MGQLAVSSVFWLVLLCSCAPSARVQAQDGLRSQSQAVRDATAEDVRVNFVPTARSKWEPALEAVRQLVSRDAVVDLLEGLGATPGIMMRSGQTSNESFRLDDEWVLHCHFHQADAGAKLHMAELHQSMNNIWVAPPAGFTGTWRTYFINGYVSHEIEYVNGEYSGSLTMFRHDGSRAVVQHYTDGVAQGEDTGYFPSGNVMYRGRYENDVRVSTWVHYNENGTVRDQEELSGPET